MQSIKNKEREQCPTITGNPEILSTDLGTEEAKGGGGGEETWRTGVREYCHSDGGPGTGAP